MQSLWAFAVAIYADEQVKTVCLDLQDNYAADVCVLFALLFLDVNKVFVNEEQVRVLERCVRYWQLYVTGSLRAVRVRLKKYRVVAAVYRQLLAVELAAEKRALAVLQRHINRYIYPADGNVTPGSADPAAAEPHEGGMALLIYLDCIGVPQQLTSSAIATLWAAAAGYNKSL